MACLRCGTCCVAPDIAALDKPLGVRCPHLTDQQGCSIYERRPAVCRAYQPDELCEAVRAATIEERTARYLELFGLAAEARLVQEAKAVSMKQARKRP